MSETRFRTYSEKFNYLQTAKGQKAFVVGTLAYFAYHYFTRCKPDDQKLAIPWHIHMDRWLSRTDSYK